MTLISRISKCMVELEEYEYTFKVEDSAQAQLADLLTYQAHEKKTEVPKVVVPQPPAKVILDAHTLFFDEDYGRGVGKFRGGFVFLSTLVEVELEKTVVLAESMSKNEANFCILIVGLKACINRGVQHLMVKGDALMVVKQVMGV